MRTLAFGILILVGSLASAQDRKKEAPRGYPGVDPKRVDEAIRRGMDYLKTAPSPAGSKGIQNSDELMLLAWVHGGLPQADPAFKEMFDRMLQSKLTHTYKVALQAMVLEEVHRVRYQDRIAQCGQALIDSQLKHGQWNYECSTEAQPGTPTMVPTKPVTSGGKAPPKGAPDPNRGTPAEGSKPKPPVQRTIPLARSKFSPSERGDDSNSQYAALGLRACHDAGILIPQEVLELARKWWETSQQGAPAKTNDRPDVSTGGAAPAPPRGWDYAKGGKPAEKPFGSMTAGAVSALVIYDYMLKKDWKTDPAVQSGMSWLNEQFTVATNPGKYPEWHYYYLYALERVGMLYNTWSIGSHDWYREGANYLLDAQKPDGSWKGGAGGEGQAVWDTCFAILFLKRATRTLDVISVDPFNKK